MKAWLAQSPDRRPFFWIGRSRWKDGSGGRPPTSTVVSVAVVEVVVAAVVAVVAPAAVEGALVVGFPLGHAA